MERSYENYRTALLAAGGNRAGEALKPVVAAAVAARRAIGTLHAVGLEPADAGEPAPHDVGTNMRRAYAGLVEAILYTEEPILDGMGRDEAVRAVSAAINAMADGPFREDRAWSPRQDAVDEFERRLRLAARNGCPEIYDVASGIADRLLGSSRMDAGMRDAVQDCLAGTLRRKLSGRARPSAKTLQDATAPAVIRTLSMCGMPDGLLPDREGTRELLLSALRENERSIDACWKLLRQTPENTNDRKETTK